jgi:hypothetical protein
MVTQRAVESAEGQASAGYILRTQSGLAVRSVIIRCQPFWPGGPPLRMKMAGQPGRYNTPAAWGYGLRARYSNCQRTVALVSGRLSVPEYSVHVAPRRTFSRQDPGSTCRPIGKYHTARRKRSGFDGLRRWVLELRFLKSVGCETVKIFEIVVTHPRAPLRFAHNER